MSKILKITVGLTVSGNMTTKKYPVGYDPKKIEILCYELFGDPAAVAARGDNKEYCIGVVNDADATVFLASPDVIEINESTAGTLGATLRPQRTVITDPVAVITILEKLRLAQSLTVDEQNAIDPDNAAKGVNRGVAFSGLLTAAITRKA